MTRTALYKLQYATALSTGVIAAAVLSWRLRDHSLILLAVALIFLLPGRLSGYLWRDLYRGRRLHDLAQYEASLESSRRFVARVVEHPYLRRLWWLAWAVYTRDPLAMAYNNIGSAQLELGRLEEAETSFQEALATDAEFPIPHFNLAVLHTIRNRSMKAEEHAHSALRLGYPRNAVDRLLERASRVLARIEGGAC